jgi:hypothetical protein
MHFKGDLGCNRGYEGWLAKEARKRNPDIKVGCNHHAAPHRVSTDWTALGSPVWAIGMHTVRRHYHCISSIDSRRRGVLGLGVSGLGLGGCRSGLCHGASQDGLATTRTSPTTTLSTRLRG